MNGVFQSVTVIDTIIFWKVKDLLMWQTTVWETLKLHNSHCFQLNAWHDRLAHWKRWGRGEETSSNLCWWTHSFPSKQQAHYRPTEEIVDKKIQLALKIQIAVGWVSRLASSELHTHAVLMVLPGAGWALADLARRAALITFPSTRMALLSSATAGLSLHIHQIWNSCLRQLGTGSSFSIIHICWLF